MNMIKLRKMTTTLMLAASMLFLFEACTVDPCENVICQNDGTCIEGDCECPEGFAGTECEFTLAESIAGEYTVLTSCNTGESYPSSVIVDPDFPDQNNRVRITNPSQVGENFFYPATITSETELNIPAFTIVGTSIMGNGTGIIQEDGSIILSVFYNGSECVETLTPQ